MARVQPLRVCHMLYKPDAKHTLIKVLSKVSIRQFCTRFAFLTECGLYGWIVSQSVGSFRKRPKRQGEALRDNLYLRRWYNCTTYAFRCVRLTSLSRDDDCACASSTTCIRPVLSVFRAVLLCGPYVEVKSPIATIMRIRYDSVVRRRLRGGFRG